MSNDWYANRLQAQQTPGRTAPAPTYGIAVAPQQAAPQPAPNQPAVVQTPAPASLSDFLRGNASKGGEAAAVDGARTCPNCGSGNLFSQVGQAVMNTHGSLVAPAPKCYDCGWNGKFAQADQATWATAG